MRITNVVTLGFVLWSLTSASGAKQIEVVDWTGRVDIPDRGEYSQTYVLTGAPAGAKVTYALCEVVAAGRGDDNFWCSDYEIGLACESQGGPAKYQWLWDNAGGRMDKGADDDAEDDSDIELSRRITAFSGENANQKWYICIRDTVSFHPVLPPQAGLGCVKRIRLVLYLDPIRYVSAGATGKNDGSSWANAFVHLQDALAAAQAGDQIWVGAGVYKPDQGLKQTPRDRTATFRLKNGVTLMGGFAGPGQPQLDVRNPGRYETVLSGDLLGNDSATIDPAKLLTEPTLADNSLHVVMAVNCDSSTILDGLTIAYGNANGATTAENRGAGLFNDPSSPTIRDCTFRNNAAAMFGAGMYNDYNSKSEPNLVRCTFRANTALNGAAIYSHSTCNPTLTDCLFERNTATSGAGAAVTVYLGSATLTDCNFVDNAAKSGGALYCSQSTVTLNHCAFTDNSAIEDGGAVKCDANSVPTLTGCTFTDNTAKRGGALSIWNNSVGRAWDCVFLGNTASVYGGAIYANTCEQTLANCTLTGNTSDSDGGAILAHKAKLTLINDRLLGNVTQGYAGGFKNSASEALLFGCVFSGNVAQKSGGGLWILNCTVPTYLGNCTFSRNTGVTSGGGVYDTNSVPATLVNSILWGNTAVQGGQIALASGAALTVQRCDVQDGQPKVSVVASTLTWGAGNLLADPRFVDADGADNVAGTEDDRLDLAAGSPCIDAGDDKQVSADEADLDDDGDTAERIPLDIQGHPRFVDNSAVANTGVADPPKYTAIVDMGPYEHGK